jgi:hypothetical protein
MPYSIPPIGTVLLAKENSNPTIPNPGPTTAQTDFYQWTQAVAQDMAFRQNIKAASGYKNWSFPSWLTETYPFQPDPDLAPPQPPAAFVVLAAPAEAACVDFQVVPSGTTVVMSFTPPEGFSQSYSTGQHIPVCAVPVYTKIAPPANPADNKIA